jgi:hypothetical protein
VLHLPTWRGSVLTPVYSPPRRCEHHADRSNHELRLVERDVMAATLGDHLLADA